jgi:hypothetical protein
MTPTHTVYLTTAQRETVDRLTEGAISITQADLLTGNVTAGWIRVEQGFGGDKSFTIDRQGEVQP